MNSSASDQELLRRYCEQRSEQAFEELVQRHVSVVFSAAKRILRDPSQAEDVTQQVFLTLAGNASKLCRHPVLCGWLHRATRNLAGNLLRSEGRRRIREQEVAHMHGEIEPETTWALAEPQLDEALCDLSNDDREVVLLRFFHGRSAREIANDLFISDVAAQKRVNRAVERLRRILQRRGVTVGVQGLAASISAHGSEAVPSGLARTISSALASATIHKGSLFAGQAGLTITHMQRSFIAVSVAAVVGVTAWQVRQSFVRQDRMQILEQRLASLAAKVSEARLQNAALSNRLKANQAEDQRLKGLVSAIPKLRREISQLNAAEPRPATVETTDPAVKRWLERVKVLKGLSTSMPDKAIPELALLDDDDWIEVAKNTLEFDEPDTNGQFKWYLLNSRPFSLMNRKDNTRMSETEKARLRLQELRGKAKLKFGSAMLGAVIAYAASNEGRPLADIGDLRPYFPTPPDEDMLARYDVMREGPSKQQPSRTVVVSEKAFADPLYDTRLVIEGNALRLREMIEVEATAKPDTRR